MSPGNQGVFWLLKEVTFRKFLVFFLAQCSRKNVLQNRNLLLTYTSQETILSVQHRGDLIATIDYPL